MRTLLPFIVIDYKTISANIKSYAKNFTIPIFMCKYCSYNCQWNIRVNCSTARYYEDLIFRNHARFAKIGQTYYGNNDVKEFSQCFLYIHWVFALHTFCGFKFSTCLISHRISSYFNGWIKGIHVSRNGCE